MNLTTKSSTTSDVDLMTRARCVAALRVTAAETAAEAADGRGCGDVDVTRGGKPAGNRQGTKRLGRLAACRDRDLGVDCWAWGRFCLPAKPRTCCAWPDLGFDFGPSRRWTCKSYPPLIPARPEVLFPVSPAPELAGIASLVSHRPVYSSYSKAAISPRFHNTGHPDAPPLS